MGAPGWPEFAFCTASIARVRMVLMLRSVQLLAGQQRLLARHHRRLSLGPEFRVVYLRAGGDSASQILRQKKTPTSASLPRFREACVDEQSEIANLFQTDFLISI